MNKIRFGFEATVMIVFGLPGLAFLIVVLFPQVALGYLRPHVIRNPEIFAIIAGLSLGLALVAFSSVVVNRRRLKQNSAKEISAGGEK